MPNVQRVRIVEGWITPKSAIPLNIEIATVEDHPLVLKFMEEQTRVQEPAVSALGPQKGEMSNLFTGLLDRAIGSGYSLLMFREDELIGIRLASVANMPKERITEEFTFLPDYKHVIDRQPSNSRKDQQISALCEIMYAFGPKFIPLGVDQYFCMELINVKPAYQGDGLATKLYQELFKLCASRGLRYGEVICTAKASQRICQKVGMEVKLQVPFDKIKDGGEVFIKNTIDGSTFAQLLIADLKEMGYVQ